MLNKTYVLTLKHIRDMSLKDGFPPTMAELATYRGLSPTGAKKHVGILCREGLLTTRPESTRSAVLTDSGRKVLKNRT